MIDEPSIDDMKAANPGSIFAAENGKVENAIEVLEKEASTRNPSNKWGKFKKETLEASAKILKDEVEWNDS